MARPAGSRNKVTRKLQLQVEQSGETSLQFMLKVMRDESLETAARMDAAKGAAPYVHPKLANIEHGNLNNKPFLVGLLESDIDG